MAIIEQKGGAVFAVDALDWGDLEKTVTLGIPMDQVRARANRGLRHMLGQMYGIIEPGMINAKHIYRGLNRAMYVNGNSKADADKFAYCWTPKSDFYLGGSRFDPQLEKRDAPLKRVYVAIVSPNEDLTNFPDIVGWIEHWSWVDSCPNNSTRPIDHETRYKNELK